MASLVSGILSRSNLEKAKRVPTYIFIDEFENFSNLPGIELLFTESRKFNVKIIV